MKILLIHRDIGTGSVGKIVEDLYYGITANGDECKIAYGFINKSKIPTNELVSVCDKKTLKMHVIYSRITDKSGFFGKRQTEKLIELIKEYEPDIIHIHGLYGYWIDVYTLYNFLKTTDIIVVNTLHSCWDFTGHCCYFTKAKCTKWTEHCNNCPEKRKYPASFFIDNSFNNFKEKKKLTCSIKNMCFVAPSEWMAQCVKQSFLKNYRIEVINNGIDLISFKANSDVNVLKYGIDKKKKIILGVASNWEDRKGLDDFIGLSKIISEKYQIVLVGLNRKQIKEMPQNIISIERTENKEDLAKIYAVATVFFNPTYEDNYPTVNLEAIACGTPVVTYKTGGSSEIVKKLSAGKIIMNKDYNSLLQFTDYYSENPLVLPKNQILYLSKDRMVQEYLNLYYQLYKTVSFI